MTRYFVIRNSEGDTYVESLSREVLQERLSEGYYGSDIDYLSTVPEMDTNYWGESMLIIKGEIAVPQAVQKVTEYKL